MQACGMPSGRKACGDNTSDVYDQSVKRAADLERKCRGTDHRTPFSGPQKYVQELWKLIDLQKVRIQHLEQYLCDLAAEGKPPKLPIIVPEQVKLVHLPVQLVGSVLGHELYVFTALHNYYHQELNLTKLTPDHNEHTAVRLVFQRMKSRLPAEDLRAIVSGQGKEGRLIVIFMHNIASGHESGLKPAGPSNTDPGCWQSFKQQCLLVTDMTFDESHVYMHSINKSAISAMAQTLSQIAHQKADRTPNWPDGRLIAK